VTSAVAAHLEILRAIIATKALRSGLRISRFVVGVEDDPDGSPDKVVLRTLVEANSAQTLAFWKSLDYEIDCWCAAMGARGRELLARQVGLRFHWRTR
jgi:hypothetical protein